MKIKIICVALLGLWASMAGAQTYFVENFDGAFTASPTSPGAPTGWQQVRIQPAPTQSWERDFRQNFWTGSAWLLFNQGTAPAGAVSGIGVLNIDDFNFGQGTLVRSERRIESPAFDLSTSTNPYVRFFYFNSNGTGRDMNVRVVLSADNGQTWHTLSNILNGFQTLPIGWNRINVRIPDKYKTNQVKVGFAITNRWANANPFFDSLVVQEFTPTTITSNGSGVWHNASTWIGGVVPTADHHVVIQSGHSVSINPSNTSVIARCQNLTINGSLTFGTLSNTNHIQIFGNLVVNGSLLTSANAGRTLVIGGNVTFNSGATVDLATSTFNQGNANVNTPLVQLNLNAGTIVLSNGGPVEVRNNGASTPLRIPNFIFNGSGNDTVTFAGSAPIFSYYTIGLRDGFVNPNSIFTIGNSHSINTTAQIIVNHGVYTQEPLWNATNMVTSINNRFNVGYHSLNTVSAEPRTMRQTFETPIDAGQRVMNVLTMTTHNNMEITSMTRVALSIQLNRGIINTSNSTHIVYTGGAANLQAGVDPEAIAFPNNQGSYINGPLRVNFLTANAIYNIPLGVGNAFNTNALNNNGRRVLTITPGANYPANCQILFSLNHSAARGTVSATPLHTLMPGRSLRMQRMSTGDLPASTILTIRGMNTNNPLTTDSLQAVQSQVRLVRATNINGPWSVVSGSNGVSAGFTPGTAANFNSSALGTTPLATQGEFFAFASIAPPVVYDSIFGVRDTQQFAGGTPLTNLPVALMVISGNGTVHRDVVQQLSFNTSGSTNLAPVIRAKVLYTGANATLTANASQFGTSINSPSGSMVFNDNVYLQNGLNYFWLVYDLDGTSASGDSLTAVPVSAIVGGSTRTPITPTPGFRVAVAPMLFLNATASHTILDPVETKSVHNPILRVRVNMTPLGSSVQLNAITINNLGSTSPILDVDSTTVWFTGNNPEFVNPQYIGGIDARLGTFTIPVQANLINDSNFFWITYNIPFFAGLGNVVDAQLINLNIGGSNRTPLVGNPAGNRKIRARYCDSEVADSNDTDIGRIVMRDGTDTLLVNGLGCGTNQSWATGTYTDNTSIQGIRIPKGRTITMQICNASNGPTLFQHHAMVLIDLNQNGLWEPEDSMWSSVVTNNVSHTATFSLPCHVDTGLTRMRVMIQESAAPLTVNDACLPYTYGETEDYTVRMIDFIPTFDSAYAVQQTGLTSPGTPDVPVLQVPIQAKVASCNDFRTSQLFFSTNGTTSLGDIAAAKLYRTTTGSFTTTNLLGTITSPSGVFSFSINDSLLNGTNYYWLAYDIDTGAAANNLIDATFDSLVVNGIQRYPTISNPSGSLQINAPMSYLQATAVHPDLLRMERNTTNNQLLQIPVIMSSIGAPVPVTQFRLSLTGTNNASANIDSISIWYTGNNATFTNPILFAATTPQTGIFQINGFQNLNNDSNFFWITVRIKPTANIGDTVDMMVHSLTVAAVQRTPLDTAPAGFRIIKDQYCNSIATFADDAEILQVTIGSLINASNCTVAAPGPGSVLRRYSNFSTLPPATLIAGKPLSFSIQPRTCDGNFTAMIGIWIDLNDDGDFTDADEQVYVSPTVFNYNNTSTVSGQLIIPCPPFVGLKRLRIIMEETNMLKTLLPCGSYLYGETEDYLVNIVTETPSWQFATAQQLTDTAEAATTHPILRIPVKSDANLCEPSVISQIRVGTSGTTQLSDIAAAKVFKTTTPVFSNPLLIGQTTSIGAQISINISDTLGFDTVWYWLAYDVAASAANNNLLDATFDSILYNGVWQLPSVSNPAGSVRIFTVMKYLGSTSYHPAVSNPEQGQSRVHMLAIPIQTSLLGLPLELTQVQLSVSGTNNPAANIDSIQVWTTGTDSTFTNPTLFAHTSTQTGTFSLTGSYTLQYGVNYVWVTYKLKTTANIGDTLDAQVLSLQIGGVPRTPAITSPAGFRIIRPSYCTPTHTNGTASGFFISGVQLNSLNYSGTASGSPFFTFFDTLSTTIEGGGWYQLTIQTGTQTSNSLAAWIDYNGNGLFETNEKIGEAIAVGASHTFSFYVPVQVSNIQTRMRVLVHDSIGVFFAPCATYLAGETKDFAILINAAAPSQSYIWNVGGTGNFATASNWIPNRALPRLQDVLVFNSGTSTSVSNVQPQKVAGMLITSGTRVNWEGATLFVTDSFELFGLMNMQSNTAIGAGDRTLGVVKSGSITGGGLINGSITRWVDTTTGVVVLPVAQNDTNRTVTIQFVVPPSAQGTLTAAFIHQATGNNGLPYTDSSFTINKAMQEGYWSITPGNGQSGGVYNLSLNGMHVRGINSLTATAIAHRSNAASPWIAQGLYVSATGTPSMPQFNRNNLTVWGQFTAASDSAINPLPVTWLRFSGTRLQLDAQLNWTVAGEQAGEWYIIERSWDGVHFETINLMQIARSSAANSSRGYTDNGVFNYASEVYYRIGNQTPDGKINYSNTIRIAESGQEIWNAIVLPNPFTNELTIELNASDAGLAEIKITNALGTAMLQQSNQLLGGKQLIRFSKLHQWPAGVYYISITINGEQKVLRAVKQ